MTAILFALVGAGWTTAIVAAYASIAAVVALALVVALVDRVRHGVGVPGY